MPQELATILWGALSLVVTGLISWGMALLTKFINEKITTSKENKLFLFAITAVGEAVKEVFQTFVESLKNTGKFTEEAQKEAKQRAIDLVKKQLLPEVIEYIKETFGNVDEWIDGRIESTIYDLKQLGRK